MRKHYTNAFKAEVVQELLKEEKPIAQIAAQHGIHPNQLSKWKAIALKGLPDLFSDEQKAVKAVKQSYEGQINELYAEIGRLTTQLAWLKKKSGIESQ
jgi:transposase-like protein